MSRRPKANRRRPARDGLLVQELLISNVHSALRDDSYSIIARLVDETLKDRKLRGKIQDHTRQILKLIARNA